MKKLIIFLLFSFLLSCDGRSDSSTKSAEEAVLTEMATNIANISASINCSDAADWKIVGIGVKACGGPTSYIAYHKSVESTILPLINSYNSYMEAFNKRWNVISDCSVNNMPSKVECINGKVALSY